MLCTHHCLGLPYSGDTIKATLTITESPLPNQAGAGLLKTDGSFTSNQIADNKYEIFMEQAHTQNNLVAESALRMVHDVIQIKCGLPYCVTCPSMKYGYGSRVPKPGYEAEPSGGGIPGSVRILGQVTQFWQNILNLYQSTDSWKLFPYPLLAFCQRGAVWVAAESGNLWSWALHTTHYYYNYQYFCIQWH